MRFFPLLIGLLLLGCASAEMRYDPAPAPIDVGYYTMLFEYGDRLEMGQMGVSFDPSESVSGKMIHAYSPLPGAVQVYSRQCGLDFREYIEEPGRFSWDLGKWFPNTQTVCVVDLYFQWELPKGMKTSYPIRGLGGRVYLRRRPPRSNGAMLTWENSDKPTQGIAHAQFRAKGIQNDPVTMPIGEPLSLKVKTSSAVPRGKWQLYGCGNGLKDQDFSGDEITILRDTIVGPAKKGSCVMFGWAIGDGLEDDFIVAADIFDVSNVKLSATIDLQDDRMCYAAEDSVSLVVFVDGVNNAASNKLRDCFKGTSGKVGFFTHKGRAVYASIEGGKVSWIQ